MSAIVTMPRRAPAWARRLAAAAVAAGGFAVAGAAMAAAPAVPAAPATVRIAAPAQAGEGGALGYTGTAAVVIDSGWLQAELARRGIRLEWVPAAANNVATQVNEAFAQHRIDYAAYGDLPSLIANASGIRTRLIVPGGSINNSYLVVPAGSTVRGVADLKGKRIALHRGRPWEYTFARLIAAQGLGFKDFRILNLNPQAGAAALATGSADAFFTLSDAFLLEDKGVGRIVWSSKTPPQDWKMRAELWGDADFVAARPELTQVVAEAFVRAQHWVSQESNREAYVRIATRAGQPDSVVRREIAGEPGAWKDRWSPRFGPALAAHYADEAVYAQTAGLIRRPVDTRALFEPRFVQQALSDLRLQDYWSGESGSDESGRGS